MQLHSLAAARSQPMWVDIDPPAVALDPTHLRILIVDEDKRAAESLKYTLHDLGYFMTFTAYSARTALIAAADFSPAVALLDLRLSDMTGYELAQKLRSHLQRYVRQMHLLAIAERRVFGDAALTRAAGFTGCLTKPVPPMMLNTMLRKLNVDRERR